MEALKTRSGIVAVDECNKIALDLQVGEQIQQIRPQYLLL